MISFCGHLENPIIKVVKGQLKMQEISLIFISICFRTNRCQKLTPDPPSLILELSSQICLVKELVSAVLPVGECKYNTMEKILGSKSMV